MTEHCTAFLSFIGWQVLQQCKSERAVQAIVPRTRSVLFHQARKNAWEARSWVSRLIDLR